ncbi:MAG TPA: hypothetical protein VLB01_03695, partial [Thermodesulfobacteriota bacterium]|nr:hypothetical protein [Thermodesulfobacteriota bacterium]
MSDETVNLDFYGILIRVVSNDREVLSFIESDFSYFCVRSFEKDRAPQITASVFFSEPSFERIPEGTLAAYHTKDAAVYKNGDVQYYDSFGKALVIYDFSHGSAEIYSLDRDLLYEKSYLLIMSRVGELLDRKGFHRIHAMGVVYKGKAVLCLLPMGGGKTTLTLSLLENKDFSLLSEEVPLVSSKGFLYPFPVRMGVTEGTSLSIPEEFLKPFKRTHYHPKVLIDTRYFKDQIAGFAEPGFIFVGKRVHSAKPEIIKISSFKAFAALFRLCVMGIGLPQILEYLLRFDFFDIVRQSPSFLSRLRASLSLLRRSEAYELHLGYDRAANAELVADFISKRIT